MRTFETRVVDQGFCVVAGIDEAGRGPLAGPVVSAAVVLPPSYVNLLIDDSKRLTPKKRASLYDQIYTDAVTIGIGIVDAVEIDRINILQATRLSMVMAVSNLSPQPDFLLIDGNAGIALPVKQQPIVRGDSLSISIAAASIIAKVTRDRLMERYSLDYPEFGFAVHKGYPTRAHREAVLKYGRTPIHRLSFTVKL
jgi:ribonuclease HII